MSADHACVLTYRRADVHKHISNPQSQTALPGGGLGGAFRPPRACFNVRRGCKHVPPTSLQLSAGLSCLVLFGSRGSARVVVPAAKECEALGDFTEMNLCVRVCQLAL